MKNIFFLISLLSSNFIHSQENLEPLRTNFKLLENSILQRSGSVSSNDFIYLTDTLSLPLIDDFSTNKFKNYIVDTSLPYVKDSSWFKLYYLDGTMVPLSASFMTSPTYKMVYDSVNINGVDTISEQSYPWATDTLVVKNFSFYPITFDTLIVWPNITHIDSLWTLANPDISFSNALPDLAQDSMVLFFVDPSSDDLNKIWLDSDVFLNDNFSPNPWTLGTVTFDGLDGSGEPYDWNTGAIDWADYLTSKPLFLSQKSLSDSLYFSFFFQAGGNGDIPESDDSLVLEFYTPTNNQWVSIWSTGGFESDSWYYEHILLDNSIYFQDGFKFRFKSYGSLTGSLDHWNLDYVYLNENRSQNDTLMNDWAFTNVPISVLETYSSVPWKHYALASTDVVLNSLVIPSYNSSNNQKLLKPCSMDLFYNNALVSSHPYSATVLNVPSLSYFDMFYDYGNTLSLASAVNDTFVDFDFRYYLSTNTTPERLSENDTIYHKQLFHNYYSYDDGYAEAAYGLVGNGAELAYRYTLLDGVGQDTLKAIKIHFSPSVYDASNDPFFLQIWSDSLGQPGSLVYSSDNLDFPELYYPHYNSGLNGFYEYELPILVAVEDTFYIGWKQSTASRLNIGFDKNVDTKSNIFYNLGSGFQNTIFNGSLMMRPVFTSNMDNILNAGEIKYLNNSNNIFPNPANSIFNISAKGFGVLNAFDLKGRLIFEKEFMGNTSIMVNSWENGVYIILIKMHNGNTVRKKLIIQH